MLYQFSFKNFKSYKNETIFDMRAESIKEFEETILVDKNGERVLPVSVIYGQNAGGKSGLLEALVCFFSIILKPRVVLKIQKNSRFAFFDEVIPYKFDEESKNNPTEFEIFFSTCCNEYRYKLSILDKKVLYESLYKKEFNGKKPAKIFERKKKNIELGEILKKSNASININENIPYLTFLSITNNIAIINDVINWFEHITAINYAQDAVEKNLTICDKEAKRKFIELINVMDIDICDYRLEEKEEGKGIKIFTKHKNNDKEYELNLLEESAGTKKLFSILPEIIIAIMNGNLVILDELDAKLHPKLLKYIIMMFKGKINIKKAQLIFTSQDLATMNNQVFRRDEIWFACKNENKESDIYSLYEIRDENGEHIRANATFSKQYLEGKYGADPYLERMLNWEAKDVGNTCKEE
ncbi:MAG: ATP-binding protein [Clostridia bacterium]|nr:ATP-binding protein [Clostridia bacterium]